MAFTKILGPGIHTLANFHSHNINSSGIITATKFVGDMEPGGGTGSFDSLTVTGNLGVGGTVTYTDVTNVDAVGIITAQSGIYIGAGATVGSINTTTGISSFKKLNVDETLYVGSATTITSTLDVTSSVGIADSIIHTGNTDTSIRFPSDDTFTVETAGSEALRIDSDGYVGIGTVDPQSLLHVYSNSAVYSKLESTNGAATFDLRQTNKYGSLNYYYQGTHKWLFGQVNQESDISLYQPSGVASGENPYRIVVKASGNIGIHSSSPTTTLDVTGTTKTEKLHVTGISTFADDVTFIDGFGNSNHVVYDKSQTALTFPSGKNTGTEFPAIIFGDRTSGGDTKLYNDYYNTHFKHIGVGNFVISSTSNAINFQGANGSGGVISSIVIPSGATAGVKLYQANATRFETIGIGVSVHGEIVTSQDYPNYRPTLDFNFAAEKKLDPRITYSRTGPASYTDEFGIVKLVGDNAPRFDHDPVTKESKGLLIEDSRTNLVADNTNYSGWVNYSATHAKTTDVKAPDGSYNALKVTSTGSQSQFGIYDTISYTANTKYTHSMWLKAGTATRVGLSVSSGTKWSVMPYLVVDLDTGTVNATGSSLSTKLTAYPNGWYLLEATGTFGSSTQSDALWSYTAQTGGFSGNTTAYFYQWGGQVEAGTFATSFIPTNGTIATRFGDYVGITGDDHTDFWNTTEGTYLINYNPIEPAVGDGVIIGSKRGNNGSGYPWPLYRHDTATTNQYKSYDLDTGIVSISSAWADQQESWALGFNGTNGSIARNGSQLITNNTSMKGLINATELWIGSNSTGSLYSMHVKRFIYYPKRITDSQLVTLTS